ncbi:MAG: SGNH/GDSL hydrolase family protein [Alphaproteobacteria bacterium]
MAETRLSGSGAPRSRRAGVFRRALLVAGFLALNLLVLEFATRAWFAWRLGPRILAYGTRWHRSEPSKDAFKWSVQSHQNDFGDFKAYDPAALGYSKYFPGDKKWTDSPDRAERWPVRINNQGFRGADFEIEKAPGTIRILTTGASSTFGYHDRDDETYPFLLERELQRRAGPGRRVEVINFAIPHAMTDNVLAMFLAEGVRLQPDVVTFYEGANDAAVIEPRPGTTPARSLRQRLADRSLLAALYDSVAPPPDADELDVAWWWSDDLAKRRSEHFLGNLKRFADECAKRGIKLVVATQQFQSTLLTPEQRRATTYDAEVEIIRRKAAAGEMGPASRSVLVGGKPGEVTDLVLDLRKAGQDPMAARHLAGFDPPRAMLVHARLMDDVRTWAGSPGSGVTLVDTIRALDPHRDWMVNWVHLDGRANAVIAEALADAIAPMLGLAAAPEAGQALSGARRKMQDDDRDEPIPLP